MKTNRDSVKRKMAGAVGGSLEVGTVIYRECVDDVC